MQKSVIFVKQNSLKSSLQIKIIKIIVITQVNTHKICSLKLNVPSEILVVFHTGSNYGYHFIIKELPCEFEGEFELLGKTKKSIKLFLFQ